MKASFIVFNRNKAGWVGRSVAGALKQTYPCEILIEDFASTDDSRAEIEHAIENTPKGNKDSRVEFTKNDAPTESTMRKVNEAIISMAQRAKGEWIFHSSSDDYSLPDRVRVCMNEIAKKECVGVATTMFFAKPGETISMQTPVSGFPLSTGYVRASEGITKLAYGSTIWAYKRDWLLNIGSAGDSTADVYYGFLASLDKGYYVIANPQHVHVYHEGMDNIGFGGRLKAAERSGDKATILRINELNHFQLMELYLSTAAKAFEKYPLAHQEDKTAVLNMILAQAGGWLSARKALHAEKITPDIL